VPPDRIGLDKQKSALSKALNQNVYKYQPFALFEKSFFEAFEFWPFLPSK